MKISNNPRKISSASLLVCFFLSGCQLFAIGDKKLNKYCPGLNIKVDGFNWHENWRDSHSINTYILQYDQSYHQKVVNYFADPAKGYTKEFGRTYYAQNIKEGMPDAIDTTTVGRIINRGKDTSASVYFDVTTDWIIIIEKAKQ